MQYTFMSFSLMRALYYFFMRFLFFIHHEWEEGTEKSGISGPQSAFFVHQQTQKNNINRENMRLLREASRQRG